MEGELWSRESFVLLCDLHIPHTYLTLLKVQTHSPDFVLYFPWVSQVAWVLNMLLKLHAIVMQTRFLRHNSRCLLAQTDGVLRNVKSSCLPHSSHGNQQTHHQQLIKAGFKQLVVFAV